MINYFAISHPGKIREKNEDSFYVDGKIVELSGTKMMNKLDMAVCDGMGGEKYGEEASQAAVQIIKAACEDSHGDKRLSHEFIKDICDKANDTVCELIRKKGERMGSTLTLARFYKKEVVLANLGDSKIFILRDGALTQLSKDHSTVARMVRDGLITKEEAKNHPAAHQITQYLGIFPEEMVIEPYIVTEKVRKNDIFLLCSDGLTDMVDETEILDILQTKDSIKTRGQMLLDKALTNGGKDNITIALAEVILG